MLPPTGASETPSELSNEFTLILARNGFPEAVGLRPAKVIDRSNWPDWSNPTCIKCYYEGQLISVYMHGQYKFYYSFTMLLEGWVIVINFNRISSLTENVMTTDISAIIQGKKGNISHICLVFGDKRQKLCDPYKDLQHKRHLKTPLISVVITFTVRKMYYGSKGNSHAGGWGGGRGIVWRCPWQHSHVFSAISNHIVKQSRFFYTQY